MWFGKFMAMSGIKGFYGILRGTMEYQQKYTEKTKDKV